MRLGKAWQSFVIIDLLDNARAIKQYSVQPVPEQRWCSPAEFAGSQKRVVSGTLDMAQVLTGYAEHWNLTMLMGIRRFTRLTNGFSNKVENFERAVSLHLCTTTLPAFTRRRA